MATSKDSHVLKYEEACRDIVRSFYRKYLFVPEDDWTAEECDKRAVEEIDEDMYAIGGDVSGVWSYREDSYWGIGLMYEALKLDAEKEKLMDWYWESVEAGIEGRDGFPNLKNYLKMKK